MGNCCTPQITSRSSNQNREQESQVQRQRPSGHSSDIRGTALNAMSITELRQKYTKLLNEKDKVITKNQQQIQSKQNLLKELETNGKKMDSDKIRRQIDTHIKLINQAKAQRTKIQQKIDNL